MEKNAFKNDTFEKAPEAMWKQLIDHETESGEHLFVLSDCYRPTDPDAYQAYIELDGNVRELSVVSAYASVDNSRRWIRCIVFDDESSVIMDVQRFTMNYLRGRRSDFLKPRKTAHETIDL